MAATPDAAGRPLQVAVRPIARAPGYGGLITRVLGAAVDAAIINLVALGVGAVVALVLSIFPVSGDTKTLLAAAGGVLFATWTIAYFVVFWTTTGQTPGDRVMRIRVVRTNGDTLRPVRAVARFAGAVLGLVLFLGYIPILLTRRRRAFHDWLADTVVVASSHGDVLAALTD